MGNPEYLQSLPFDNAYWPPLEASDLLVGDAPETRSESPAATDVEADVISARQSQPRHGHGTLPLLQLADWSEDKTYDEHPPTCIHYSIEWKLTVNSKLVAKDTEPNLVLAPNAFWTTVLRSKLNNLLARKLPQNKSYRVDDTSVVVFVTDRTERDLVKRFDDLNIEWTILEKQLQTWGYLFRIRKRLRIDISFNYIETSNLVGV